MCHRSLAAPGVNVLSLFTPPPKRKMAPFRYEMEWEDRSAGTSPVAGRRSHFMLVIFFSSKSLPQCLII